MTDSESHDADGYVIVHHPADGSAAYAIGPFPPIQLLVDLMRDGAACDCRRESMPIAFPPGVHMGIELPDDIAVALANSSDKLN